MKGFGKKQISSNKNSKGSNFKKELDKKVAQAFRYHTNGNLLEASKYYQYIIDEGCHNPDVYINYGVICKQNGHIEKALILFKRFCLGLFLCIFFLLSSVRKTLNILRFGFFKASITACLPTIKNDLLFINSSVFYTFFYLFSY